MTPDHKKSERFYADETLSETSEMSRIIYFPLNEACCNSQCYSIWLQRIHSDLDSEKFSKTNVSILKKSRIGPSLFETHIYVHVQRKNTIGGSCLNL